jgi:hypothetical protein
LVQHNSSSFGTFVPIVRRQLRKIADEARAKLCEFDTVIDWMKSTGC